MCGAGCMGFVNVARGLRAIGYVEPDPLPAGPVALITHSGSVFSALLRARRGFGFSLAVSSGQELVTTAAAYARYALGLAETRVLALVLEAIRDAPELRAVLARRWPRDVPVVLLSVGAVARRAGPGLGALRRAGRGRRRLGGAGRRVRRAPGRATWPSWRTPWSCSASASRRAAPATTAPASPPCTTPAWNARTSRTSPPSSACRSPRSAGHHRPAGGGARPRPRTRQPAGRVGHRPGHRAAVRRVPVRAGRRPAGRARSPSPSTWCPSSTATTPTRGPCSPRRRAPAKPVAVLAGLPAAVDPAAAARLRAAGVPVLEGTRSGLLALRHLLDHAAAPPHAAEPPARGRPPGGRAGRRLLRRPARAAPSCSTCCATTASRPSAPGRPAPAPQALAAAAEIGYPVVLKTDEPRHRAQVRRRRGPARPRRPRRGRRRLRRPGRPPRPARRWCARRPRPAPSWPWAWSATPPSVRSWSSAPAAS